MTPKKDKLTPQAAIRWLGELRRASEKRGCDGATKYQIRYMFKYIEKIVQYQEVMPPINIDDDGHYFECPRCGQAFESEYHVDDFVFCQKCGQRFKEDEDD